LKQREKGFFLSGVNHRLRSPLSRPSSVLEGLGAREYTDIGAGLDQNLNQGEFEWADYEDDGDLDLLVAAQNRTTIYQNAGGDVFGKVNIGIPGVRNGSSADWGDYDGDGDLDIVVSGYSRKLGKKITRIYQNKGDETFQWLKAGLTGVNRSTVKWGDYDQDGDLDLVIAGYDEQGNPITRIYRNDGTDFTEIDAGLEGVGNASLDWGDYDSDGDRDLIVIGRNDDGAQTLLYRNDGSGSFAKVTTDLPNTFKGVAEWGDYNEDGKPDLLLVGRDGKDDIFQNEGSGVFTGIDAGLPDLGEASNWKEADAQWGDADGDGDLDVLLGGGTETGSKTDVYRNEGDTSFVATESGFFGPQRPIVAWGDYDSDGDLDLAVGGRDKAARIYRSDGDGAPWQPRDLAVVSKVLNVNLSWTASPSEDGDVTRYRIYRDTVPIDSSAGPSGLTPVATVDTPATSYTDTGVETDTEYYYRVTAVDSADLESGFTGEVTAIPEDRLPGPAAFTAVPSGADVELSWDGIEASTLQKYYIYRDTAPIDSLSGPIGRAPYDSTTAGNTTFVDPSPEPGQTYYYRITAVNDAGEEGIFSSQDYAFLYPESVRADITRSFGDASSISDYRLVALPGGVDRSLGETLSGAAGAEWQAWWDDGTDSDFLARFDGSGTFNFRPGRGFWLTATSEWAVDDSISTVTLKNDTAATLPLNEGWTIVSNPFGKPVDWSAVDRANGEDLQPLWSFGGAFDSTMTFESAKTGRAYYFFNDTGQDSLTVPYPGAPQLQAISKETDTQAPMLALSATPDRAASDEGTASTVRMGLAEAEGAEDVLIAPPARFSAVSLRIEAPTETDSRAKSDDADDRERLLMAHRRAAEGEGATFRLRLTSQVEGPVRLSASNLQAIDGQAAALINPEAGQTYDLRAEGPVTVDGGGDAPRSLKVAIGSKQYVDQKKEQVLPKEVQFTSYPNPVRQQGTIEYALPEQKAVTLRVYDVLGRRVATLADGRKEAGRHTVRLETDNLSSGVYFGRLSAGDQTRTLKITVVR